MSKEKKFTIRAGASEVAGRSQSATAETFLEALGLLFDLTGAGELIDSGQVWIEDSKGKRVFSTENPDDVKRLIDMDEEPH